MKLNRELGRRTVWVWVFIATAVGALTAPYVLLIAGEFEISMFGTHRMFDVLRTTAAEEAIAALYRQIGFP